MESQLQGFEAMKALGIDKEGTKGVCTCCNGEIEDNLID